jgi:hypothetical protein
MHLEPDTARDEVLTVGDIGFPRRCIDHEELLGEGGWVALVSLFLVNRCVTAAWSWITAPWCSRRRRPRVARYFGPYAAPDDPLVLQAIFPTLPADPDRWRCRGIPSPHPKERHRHRRFRHQPIGPTGRLEEPADLRALPSRRRAAAVR